MSFDDDNRDHEHASDALAPFATHLETLAAAGIKLRCPVCSGADFSVESPCTNQPTRSASVVPRLPVVCTRCHHVVEFAWRAISCGADSSSFGHDNRDRDLKPDPLDAWPAFAETVRKRLEAGRATYGDKSFERPPAELVAELQQEALDLAGWGFVLWCRLERAVAKRISATGA